MSAEILFTITKENLETGMRGYPVGYCTTSSVDPQNGLFYRGRAVDELAGMEPVDVIYLLLKGALPKENERQAFSLELQKESKLQNKTVEHIRALPRQGHPMDLFCASLFVAGMFEGKGDYRQDCNAIIAKIPQIAAEVINHHAGWGGTKPSDPSLGYIENFTHMLNVPNANQKELCQVLKLFEVLHLDHGGGNLSTFVGKATASGLQHIWGSIASAMSALAGPRHGRANQDCLEFVNLVQKEIGEKGTVADVEALIRKKLENNELVFGFGHAVLRVEDPRATVLYAFAKENYPTNPLVKTALALREAGPKVLGENPKISNPFPNVDAISGTVLTAAGFPYPEYYTVLFGLSRAVGIAIQIVYERLQAREGKGTPIVRPKYLYKNN